MRLPLHKQGRKGGGASGSPGAQPAPPVCQLLPGQLLPKGVQLACASRALRCILRTEPPALQSSRTVVAATTGPEPGQDRQLTDPTCTYLPFCPAPTFFPALTTGAARQRGFCSGAARWGPAGQRHKAAGRRHRRLAGRCKRCRCFQQPAHPNPDTYWVSGMNGKLNTCRACSLPPPVCPICCSTS